MPQLVPQLFRQMNQRRVDIVADGADGVTAEDVLAGRRHRRMAGARDRVSFEAFVNSEAEDERITRSEAALHL